MTSSAVFLFMKKILLILIFCIIKLNAITFEEWENENVGNYIYKIQGPASGYIYYYYDKKNGILSSMRWNQNQQFYIADYYNYNIISMIKFRNNYADHPSKNVVKKEVFDIYLKNENFLNDLFKQKTNLILNYLYNSSVFSNDNYIQYDNYELLYNSKGLAVESIVDGVWAGLYDNDTRFLSGKLYDNTGTLQYINGKAVKQMNPFDMFNELLIVSVMDVFGVMSRTMCYLIAVSVVIIFGLFLFLLDLLHSSISRIERNGSPYIAVFDAKGKRVSKWHKNPEYEYKRYRSDVVRGNFDGWQDYQNYERKLSNDSSPSNFRKKVF